MNEHPILFSGLMVRAIRDGRKTQMRRVVKLTEKQRRAINAQSREDYREQPAVLKYSPYGLPGDLLWVRETWQQTRPRRRDGERFILRTPGKGLGDVHYAADAERDEPPKWRPSIHMPRWASRITLEVTEVRVERVQEISAEDAIAEGFTEGDVPSHRDWVPQRLFSRCWDSINEKRGYGWDANPWVWVVTFRRKEGGPTA